MGRLESIARGVEGRSTQAKMLAVTLLTLAIGLATGQNLGGDWPPFYDKHTASPLLHCPKNDETWKAPQEYLDMRTHDISNRDHGCADFPDKIEPTFHCTEFWIKNKLRWLAVYSIQQTNREQSGVIDAANYTTGKRCTRVNFPQQFASRPYVKLTQHAPCYNGGFEPNMVWIKTLDASGFEMCWVEWNQFSAFHRDHKINWYATTQITNYA